MSSPPSAARIAAPRMRSVSASMTTFIRPAVSSRSMARATPTPLLPPRRGAHAQDARVAPPLGGRRGRAEQEADALALQAALQLSGDVGVLAGEDLAAAVDHGHPAAEAAEHLPELQADVA